jgi:hypothetical protein
VVQHNNLVEQVKIDEVSRNKLAEKVEVDRVSHVTLMKSDVALVRLTQLAEGRQACFRTEQRLLCENEECEWRRSCRRLVAAWRR